MVCCWLSCGTGSLLIRERMKNKKIKIFFILISLVINALFVWLYIAMRNSSLVCWEVSSFVRDNKSYFVGFGLIFISSFSFSLFYFASQFIFKSKEVFECYLKKKPGEVFYKGPKRVIFGGFVFLLESCFGFWVDFQISSQLRYESLLFKALLGILILIFGYCAYLITKRKIWRNLEVERKFNAQ